MVKVNPQVRAASPHPRGRQVSGGLGSSPSQQSQRRWGSQLPRGRGGERAGASCTPLWPLQQSAREKPQLVPGLGVHQRAGEYWHV